MEIEKKHLELLAKVLGATSLSLADARVRDGFIRRLVTECRQMEHDREAILKKFCRKDDEGLPDTTVNDEGLPVYHFDPDVLAELNAELATLSEESVGVAPDSPHAIDKVRSFAESTDYKPMVGEAEDIDHIFSKMV